MKELSIKEKAQRYDEAYKKVAVRFGSNVANEIFLKESEDERMRKHIIEILKDYFSGEDTDKCIAWLEKQGEPTEINPSEFDSQLNRLLKQFESLPKDDIASSLSFYLNVVQNDGTYKDEKQGEQKSIDDLTQQEAMDIDVAKCFDTFEMKTPEESLGIDSETYNKIVDECIYGEQKPTDKVEPKFEIEKGKWYVCDTPRYTDFVVGKAYYCPKNGMLKPNENEIARYVARDCFHTWTIQDAKDGDVLATDSWLYIFKYTNNKGIIQFHCTCPINGEPYKWCFLSYDSYLDIYKDANIHPATKEQRDFLFKKMHDVGYEWNAEKKELKKTVVPIFNVGDIIIKKHNSDMHNFASFTITDIKDGKYWYNDGIICYITKQDEWELYKPVRQNPEWTPMDEQHVENLLAIIEGRGYPGEVKWLNSLKDRVQSKQEWNEEDNIMLQYAIEHFERQKRNCIEGGDRKKAMQEFIDWLKSLKPQKKWKPSYEQMAALNNINLTGSISYVTQGQELITLYNDLKKLK